MLRWISNIIIAVVVGIVGCFAVWALLVGEIPRDIPLLLLLLLMMAVAGWASGLTRLTGYTGRRQAGMVLTYLDQAIRLNLPLPQMLVAARASERGSLAAQLNQLLARLDCGESISDAMKKAVPGTPVRTLGLLGAAERAGSVGPELRRLVIDEQKPGDRSIAERSFLSSYPLAMAVMIVLIVTMLMTFVMPKYMQIFKDFRTPMPPVTQALINFLQLLGSNRWLQLAIELTVSAAVLLRIRWSVNLRRRAIWFTTSRQYADVCHVIAGALQAGMPLHLAIRSAGELAISQPLRNKLNRWAQNIERGMPSAEAADNAGIPRLISGLTGPVSAGPAAEAFDFLARYYAGKFSRWMTLLRAAAVPAMTIGFGVAVAFVALAMFTPIVTLIDVCMPRGGGL